MDAINLVSPHCKLALRPPYPHMIPDFIRDAYRAAFFGRPGPTFVDLPANLILGTFKELAGGKLLLRRIEEVPRSMADQTGIRRAVEALMSAKSPLVVVGKGAAYGRAEGPIRELVERTRIPFLPTPMGKGILPDSSPLNISAARSTALKQADVVLLLGARLNWILSFGLPPKWAPNVKIIQVDLSADELGKNGHDPSLSLLGDVGLVCEQLLQALSGGWQYDTAQQGEYWQKLKETKARNEAKARKKAESNKVPMTYEHAFQVIKKEVDRLSPQENGDVVYVSEGANAMDISRSIFTMEYPRTRLDAGTYATMGVGLGYAIAAYAAYNYPSPEGNIGIGIEHGPGASMNGGGTRGGATAQATPYAGAAGVNTGNKPADGKVEGGATAQPTPYGGASGTSTSPTSKTEGKVTAGASVQPTPYGGASGTSVSSPSQRKKKIVAIEGDSAFGFSMAEVETMIRYRMPILIFIINNSGLYRGDADSRSDWTKLQDMSVKGTPASPGGLSATGLGFETEYQKIAELGGDGKAWGSVARTPEELSAAVRKGWAVEEGPVVVNVLVDTTKDLVMVSCACLVFFCFVVVPKSDAVRATELTRLSGFLVARYGAAGLGERGRHWGQERIEAVNISHVSRRLRMPRMGAIQC
jgi:thiamine pyrophosphate-dependent acetolactate synthase large subunit-like protein